MEPFITSQLNVAQKIPNKEVSGLAVGVVIHSKVGPLEPTQITSPRQFLETYTVNRSLSKGDHPSLLNAYYLSVYADLVVTRATNVEDFPLVGIGKGELWNETTTNKIINLPSGDISNRLEIIRPTLRPNPGDWKSLFLQVDNVLFYGKGAMNPFDSGDGVEIDGTATAEVKATRPQDLVTNGLGTKEDYITIELSQDLVSYNELTSVITVLDSALEEIASHFKADGAAKKSYLTVNYSAGALYVYSSEGSYESSSYFQPVPDPTNEEQTNVYNLSFEASFAPYENDFPFFIGTKNVGTVNTLKAWTTEPVIDSEGFVTFVLNLKDSVRGHLNYKVSNNPDAIDAQGNPIYYTWISEIRPEIVLIENPNLDTITVANEKEPANANVGKSQEFIDSIDSYDKLISGATWAISAFEDYEDSRIQLYTDAGWYHPAIGKKLESIAMKRYGLACVSCEPSIKDVNLIKQMSSRYNSYYSIFHVNAGKDTSTVGFQIPISASCYFIESIAKNTTRNSTYAPTFSKINGTISESNLYHNFTKTQRDTLSKARVNVLMYDRTDGVAYINNNLLTDSSGSLIDEDQSIRIVNDIRFDLDQLMKNFYSLFNTAETRANVTAAVNNYFNTIILPQTYTIAGFYVVCTELNNPDAVVQNNELKVEISIKLNHSIKYITILTNVVPTL